MTRYQRSAAGISVDDNVDVKTSKIKDQRLTKNFITISTPLDFKIDESYFLDVINEIFLSGEFYVDRFVEYYVPIYDITIVFKFTVSGYINRHTVFTVKQEISSSGSSSSSSGVSSTSEEAPLLNISRFNPSSFGVGGMDEKFSILFRRAFASRTLPPTLVKQMGIKHAKGSLLHGPLGTGKLAR